MMSVAKIKLDESTKMEFGITITGASGIPETRLVIEGDQFSISYPCDNINGTIEAEIGKLKNILKEGTYPIKLEVLIDNKIYVPFEDTIEVEKDVEVVTKPKNVSNVKESVKIDKVLVVENEPNQEQIIDQYKIAAKIAEELKYKAQVTQSPADIITEALKITEKPLANNKYSLLKGLIELAEEMEIKFDKQYLENIKKIIK